MTPRYLPEGQVTAFYRYKEEHGPDEVAAQLSEALGRPVTREYVQSVGRRKQPPKAWRRALGLEDDPVIEAHTDGDEPDPTGRGAAQTDGNQGGAGRASEQPPQAPDGTRFTVPDSPGMLAKPSAQQNIAALHKMLGAGVAVAVDPDGFQNDKGVGGGVAALWDDRADAIAEAWIAWAEEGNRFAQTVVRYASMGGAGGQLATGYFMLLLGTAYIMGQAPDNQLTRGIYGKYDRYRTVVPKPEPADAGEGAGSSNGAGPESAGDAVDDASFPPRF